MKEDYGVSQINTTALATSLVAKASPGTIYDLFITNTLAAAQYVQIHDAAALPADGAVPESCVVVPASSSLAISFTGGKVMTTGIVISNSSTAPTKTIGAADCWFEVTYQ